MQGPRIRKNKANTTIRYLCLVTVIKHDEAKDKKGLIDYNCHIFQDALSEVFAKDWQKETELIDGTDSQKSMSVAQSHLESH